MKLIIVLLMLVAGTANAQDYRTIPLEGVVFTGFDEISGNIGNRNCEANAKTLANLISYFSDTGLSLTYQGDCRSGKHYDETDLTSFVRTNLPRGTYTIRSVCVGNVDKVRRLYALLSNESFQIMLAKVEASKATRSTCTEVDYPNEFLLKVNIK